MKQSSVQHSITSVDNSQKSQLYMLCIWEEPVSHREEGAYFQSGHKMLENMIHA